MKNRRGPLFLLLSAVTGLLAVFFFYRSNMNRPPPDVGAGRVVYTTSMVMAREALAPGVSIQLSQLEVVEWPDDYLPRGGMQVAADVVDRVPRRRIEAGEPILEPMLLDSGIQPGLTALISENHRAMSVQTDAVVAVGGFIQPGSRVDVLAQLRTIDRDKGATPFSRTILQNVKVLAIDQVYEPGESLDDAAPPSVVTLEVDPNQAQLLAYATAEGTLQLALRNQVDESLVSLRSTGPRDFLDEVLRPKRKPRKAASKPRKSIESIRGSDVTREYL